MSLFLGISYNLKGLRLGIKTPSLLFLGLARFIAVLVITIISTSLLIVYHQELLNLIWPKPESLWILWLWYVISWLIALLLIGLSTVISYLLTQILFSVFIMDLMSRKTEKMITGKVEHPEGVSLINQFFYLVKQEIPRAVFPIILIFLIMIISWFTPLGPVMTVLLSIITIIFLAWDNTDLMPARWMIPFRVRFRLLTKNLLFHLGFGLWFLIPLLNILFLSFAPVGATLFLIENKDYYEVKNPDQRSGLLLRKKPV
jgi:CysZ protein